MVTMVRQEQKNEIATVKIHNFDFQILGCLEMALHQFDIHNYYQLLLQLLL